MSYIRAKFRTDEQGLPLVKQGKKRLHYRIEIWIEDAPNDTYAVTYTLHDSYPEPIIESTEKPLFSKRITSYGDYEIRAKIRTRTGAERIAAMLSDALRQGDQNTNKAATDSALKDITDN